MTRGDYKVGMFKMMRQKLKKEQENLNKIEFLKNKNIGIEILKFHRCVRQ